MKTPLLPSSGVKSSEPNRFIRQLLVVYGMALLLGTGSASGQPRWSRGPSSPGSRTGVDMAGSPAGSLYLYGGSGEGRDLGDLWVWDGTRWTAGGPGPALLGPRTEHAMAYDDTRDVVVLFGGEGAGGEMNDTWEYDGSAWRQGPTAPPGLVPRREHAMAFHPGIDRVVLFGGRASGNRFDDTWLYDGTSWSAGPTAPAGLTARSETAMAYLARRDAVVLFGGRDGSGRRNDTWEFDGTAWTAGGPAPAPLVGRERHRLARLPGPDLVVLFGGYDGGELDDTWLYDGTWTQGPTAPAGLAARDDFTMATAGSSIYLLGGSDDLVSYMDDLWRFDGGWTQVSRTTPSGRAGTAMAFDGTHVVLFGGREPNTTGSYRNDTWTYDGATWALGTPAPAALTPRAGHGMAYDAALGAVVLFGGDDGGAGFRNDTWHYAASTWVAGAPPPVGLTPRRDLAMAYDAAPGRGVVVMFGGEANGGALLGDVWEYDGASWVAGAPPPVGLTPRRDLAMAYDATTGRRLAVLFGGEDATGPRNDTWEYDGTTWTAGPPAPAGLLPRAAAGMDYDAATQTVMLFGGWNTAATWYGDHWQYDGSAWTLVGAPPPDLTPRRDLAMAYDATSGRLVIFSGTDPAHFRDTFEFGQARASYLAGMGQGQPNANRIRIFDEAGNPTAVDIAAYGAAAWGVNVAAGDIVAGGDQEILAGPGPGGVHGPQARAFDRSGAPFAKVNFYAYSTLKFGVDVGGGDIDGDTHAEILTGAGPGAVFGPHVRGFNFDGVALSVIAKVNYFAYGTLKYGVNVAPANLDADPLLEIATGPGPGAVFVPQVRGFNYDATALTSMGAVNFVAFSTLRYGAQVCGGDLDGDGEGELVAAPGAGPSTSYPGRFRGFDVTGGVQQLPGFDVVISTTSYGGRPGAGDVAAGAADELLAGAGPDPVATSQLGGYLYSGAGLSPVGGFEAFPGEVYGVEPAAGDYGY